MQLPIVFKQSPVDCVPCRTHGSISLQGVRLVTQPVPVEVDGTLYSAGHRCDTVYLRGSAEQQAGNLKQGDKLHVVLSFYDYNCESAFGYSDLEEAKADYKKAEASTWREMRSWRTNPGYQYGVMKFNQYHSIMLTSRAGRPSCLLDWYLSGNAYSAWLVTLVIDGPALNLDEKGDWPPGNLPHDINDNGEKQGYDGDHDDDDDGKQ